jgi:hypothetical protein
MMATDGAPGDPDGNLPDSASDGVPGCGNQDGIIARNEAPLAAGLMATYRVGVDAAVASAGSVLSDGSRSWDFSAAMAADHDLEFAAVSPTGTWYAASFPSATFASRISDGSNLLGVYQATGNQLLLLGVVSPDGGVSRTELVYDPAVTVAMYPMQAAATWSTDSTVSGLTAGFFAVYAERSEGTVDAHGTVATPYGEFSVLRVRTVLTRTVGLVTTVTRSYHFNAECFGTVATLVSAANEPSAEFTMAAEAWRLAP